ncbi:NUDIX domain-containing protein [Priestia megaterium]|uniref:NUDIX hydrolase n=1 Tax=Priestia megaterium TaxID=1404 RepID=UPI0024467919|nr:NUDIX domain-containing protein [Priestia megaterium]WRQ94252.1 NUDIX domain-containing protein [Priestia megaterium]
MQGKTMITKVMAYITRFNGHHTELLVYKHKDYPEAGVQVPAGTVEEGETIEEALYREIKEESGLMEFLSVTKLKTYVYHHEGKSQYHERHVFHLEIKGKTAERWEYKVNSKGEDAGLIFSYYWAPIQAIPKLAVNQDDCINQLFL